MCTGRGSWRKSHAHGGVGVELGKSPEACGTSTSQSKANQEVPRCRTAVSCGHVDVEVWPNAVEAPEEKVETWVDVT
jgi:hypothetical protein